MADEFHVSEGLDKGRVNDIASAQEHIRNTCAAVQKSEEAVKAALKGRTNDAKSILANL